MKLQISLALRNEKKFPIYCWQLFLISRKLRHVKIDKKKALQENLNNLFPES